MDQKGVVEFVATDLSFINYKLGEVLFITAAAVSQRIKRLEETGQLLYYQAAIDYEQA